LTASTATSENLYSVEYDIDSSDLLCAGKIVLTKDMQLILFADGKTESREEYRCDFNEVKELQINSHIGCASLEAELKNGDRVRICRFTQSCLNQISEFIKAANYYIETGEYTEINIERTVCPKCGKHFIVNTQICPNCSNKASIVGKFLALGKKYMPAFALSGVLVLFCNVINLIIPLVNRILVDDYLFPASEGLEPWGDKNPVLMILILILIMLACYVLIRVINIAAARMRNATSAKFINSVRIKLYDKIQVLSMSSISRRTTGDLIKRVTEDTSVITEFIKSETVWMIEIGVIFIGVSGYFIATRPLLALFVFLPFRLFFLPQAVSGALLTEDTKNNGVFLQQRTVFFTILSEVSVSLKSSVQRKARSKNSQMPTESLLKLLSRMNSSGLFYSRFSASL